MLSRVMRRQGSLFVTNPNSQDMDFLRELIEAGQVTLVIDKTYPLSETAEAFRYLDQGHAHGKVVITG